MQPDARPPGRRPIDVEDALAWAFRHELPKRGGGAATGYSPLAGWIAYGTVIDGGGAGREPGFPAALGDPHPDAVAIEAAVKRLDRFAGGWTVEEIDLSSDFGLGRGWATVDPSRALRRAVACMSGSVTVHARLGDRPVCRCPRFACGPSFGANGKPRVRVTVTRLNPDDLIPTPFDVDEPAHATRAGRYPDGAFCPLAWEPHPQAILDERADYVAWWLALDQLARDLSGLLVSLAVLAPSAPARPWAGERDTGRPPVLFRPADPVYRPQRRAAAEAGRELRNRRRIAPGAAARAPRPAPPRGGQKAG